MPNDLIKIDLKVESNIKKTFRVKQVSGMFDVPLESKLTHEWKKNIELPSDWNIGLIVGPSGSGKSTIASSIFGSEKEMSWSSEKSIIDEFPSDMSIHEICEIFSSVGFNTIPSWMKPFHVLSTGEKFRVRMARLIAESKDDEIIMVDEFTSVVDRQVAKIGSNSIQKLIRRKEKKFVAVGCHYDVIDWLQPDWILDPSTMTFERRLLRRSSRNPKVGKRPEIEVSIGRVPKEMWSKFSSFHYMSETLSPTSKCFALFVDEVPVCFAAILWFPHASKKVNIVRVHRVVTLPDWQGLGLAFVLMDTLAKAYKAIGLTLRTYPAHPALMKNFDRSKNWKLEAKPKQNRRNVGSKTSRLSGAFGARPCAVFSWCGETMDEELARKILLDATYKR
jgi:ABC-type lipoprotein export system ATPase subunit/GNAT superfamily N-acetyltransferase